MAVVQQDDTSKSKIFLTPDECDSKKNMLLMNKQQQTVPQQPVASLSTEEICSLSYYLKPEYRGNPEGHTADEVDSYMNKSDTMLCQEENNSLSDVVGLTSLSRETYTDSDLLNIDLCSTTGTDPQTSDLLDTSPFTCDVFKNKYITDDISQLVMSTEGELFGTSLTDHSLGKLDPHNIFQSDSKSMDTNVQIDSFLDSTLKTTSSDSNHVPSQDILNATSNENTILQQFEMAIQESDLDKMLGT